MQNNSYGYAKYVGKGTVHMYVTELPLSGEQHWQMHPSGTCQIREWQKWWRTLNEGDKARNNSPWLPAASGLLSTSSQPLGLCTLSIWRSVTTIPMQRISSTTKCSGFVALNLFSSTVLKGVSRSWPLLCYWPPKSNVMPWAKGQLE